MPAQGDSGVAAADLADAELRARRGTRVLKAQLCLPKTRPSGQQEPFDLCFVGFNRVAYADVRGKNNSQAELTGSTDCSSGFCKAELLHHFTAGPSHRPEARP